MKVENIMEEIKARLWSWVRDRDREVNECSFKEWTGRPRYCLES